MPTNSRTVPPQTDAALDEIITALRRRPRRLFSKYFYDAQGSALFEKIRSQDVTTERPPMGRGAPGPNVRSAVIHFASESLSCVLVSKSRAS